MYENFEISIDRRKNCWHVSVRAVRPDEFGDTLDDVDDLCLRRFKPLADDPFATWVQIVAHLSRARDPREWMP